MAIVVVVVAAVVAVNLTVARLPAMPTADGKYAAIDDREIHYVEQSGQGIPVLMLHGLPGTHKDFDAVTAQVPGLHVSALDRPGFGWSRGGPAPYQDQIDAVHQFITQRNIAPVILVGHSFGGTLALGLASRYLQDIVKMILLAPGAGGMTTSTKTLLQARYIQFTHLPVIKSVVSWTFGNVALRLSAELVAREAFSPGEVDPTYQARLLAVSLTPGNLDTLVNDQLEFDQTMSWVDENASDIRVPSVVIAAADDLAGPYRLHAATRAESSWHPDDHRRREPHDPVHTPGCGGGADSRRQLLLAA